MVLLSLLTVGLVEYSSDNMNDAISSFTDALDYGKDQLSARDVYYYRGMSYMYLRELEKAFADFSQALVIDPNYVMAYNNRAVIYEYLGYPENAISDMSQAIAAAPQDVSLYCQRGTLYLNNHQYDAAIEDFNQAIALDPSDPSCFSGRGIAYYSIEDHDLAMRDLDNAIAMYQKSITPKSSSSDKFDASKTYNYRATIYLADEEYSKALTYINRAIEIRPEYANAYQIRAAIYAKLGQRELAIADLRKQISLGTTPERQAAAEKAIEALLSQQSP